MDTTEGYITAEPGIRLFYKKTGNGRKIVIVPNGFYYFNELEYLADFCTLVCYDVRNRGLSDSVSDSSKLGGIHQDVADLESLRSHFGFKKIHLIGHSYIGLMVEDVRIMAEVLGGDPASIANFDVTNIPGQDQNVNQSR